MPLPHQLLSIREIGDQRWPYWLPASLNGESLVLEPGESVLSKGSVRVQGFVPPSPRSAWDESSTNLVVTDRRIVYMRTDYEKGGGWVGFSPTGLVVATAANAVSKHQAKKRTAGKISMGQVRFEWVRGAAHVPARPKQTAIPLVLTVGTEGPQQFVQFFNLSEDFVRWIAKTIAHHRLTIPVDLCEDARAHLISLAEGATQPFPKLGTDALGWEYPGETDLLVERAFNHYMGD